MPDDHRPSKPRRRGLWAPYILVIFLFAVWSLAWVVLRERIEDNIDRTSTSLRTSGYDISWKTRTVTGYPFRFEIEMTDVKAAEPSGWGVAAPNLKAVAAAYKIDHWVFVAANGLTLWRPASGPVDIKAETLRASIADARTAPRFSFEGTKLNFQPRHGADPFPFTGAELAEIHVGPKGPDGTELLWRLENAQTRRAGILAQIAPLAPFSLRMSADIDKRGLVAGKDWADSVRHWSDGGGVINVTQMLASIGDVSINANGGPITVGGDGRLQGGLNLTFRQGGAVLAALSAMQGVQPSAAQAAAAVAGGAGYGDGAQLPLTFEAGTARVGPIRIGPSPRVY